MKYFPSVFQDITLTLEIKVLVEIPIRNRCYVTFPPLIETVQPHHFTALLYLTSVFFH